jgi:hypothetical protein
MLMSAGKIGNRKLGLDSLRGWFKRILSGIAKLLIFSFHWILVAFGLKFSPSGLLSAPKLVLSHPSIHGKIIG